MTGILLMLVGMALADEPVDVTKIPDAVKATIARDWPTAQALSARTEGNDLDVILQVDMRKMEVAFNPKDGTWSEIEEKVDPSALPGAVRSAASDQGQIIGAEKRTTNEGKVGFEIEVKADSGKIKELKMDDEGHTLSPLDKPSEEQNETPKEEKKEHEEKY